MYTSKHYTCPEIDQRLLQGYYDDAVTHGFTGTLSEFWTMVLSIKNLVVKEPGYGLSQNDFTNELKSKLDSIEEGAKLIERISQLQNDAGYQTAQDVEDAINNLIAGAPEALDTLKELAEALSDNPNFATDITNKLTELGTKLNQEVTDRKAADEALDEKVDNNEAKSKAADEALETKLNSAKSELTQKIDDVSTRVTSNTSEINKLTQKHTEDIAADKEYARTLVDTEKDRATAAEKVNADGLSELRNLHITDKAELASAISTEISERKAASNLLERDLATEVQSRKDEDAANKTVIEQEVADRKAADETLETKLSSQITTQSSNLSERITQEVSDRQNADLELKTNIVTETTERKAQDAMLDHKISDLDSKVGASNTSIEGKIVTETTERKAADTALDKAKVDKVAGKGLSTNDFTDILKNKLEGIAEEANKILRVSELENDAKYQTEADVKTLIESVIDGAPGALDTLKELAEAIGEDPNFATTLTNRITALAEQLNNEKVERTNNDTALQTQIGKEVTRATGVEDMLKEKIVQEVADRKAAITEVKATMADNKADADGKISAVTEKVNTLDQAMDTQYNDLKENIANNTAAIQANLELIQHWQTIITSTKADLIAKYEQEKADRIAADAELTKKLSDAIDDYTQKINDLKGILEGKITAEKEAREAAVDTLQQNIDRVSQSVTTEETARRAADEVLQNNITTEETARTNADTALGGRIDQEETTRQTAVDTLQQNIDRVSQSVTTEETARENADTALGNRIQKLENYDSSLVMSSEEVTAMYNEIYG